MEPSSSNSLSFTCVMFSLYIFLNLCISEAAIKLPKNVTFPAVFVFGDSIVDQGNNNNRKTVSKCNYPPYGKDLLGGIPTGRFSNGKTPPDFIAEDLGIKELVPAYLDPELQNKDLITGVSFASGGAGYDPLTSKIESAISFSGQLELFKEYIGRLKQIVGAERTNNILTNSLFLVVAGTNDIANNYLTLPIRRLQYDVASYSGFLVTSASEFLQEIYKLGARRVAIFSAPPIGCLPFQRTLGGGVHRLCAEKFIQPVKLYNKKLSSGIDSLTSSLPQARMFYIDVHDFLLDMIQNPHSYGFDVVDRGCCGTGYIEVAELCNYGSQTCPNDSKYLFWDSWHPTEKGYRFIANHFVRKYMDNFF